MVAPRLGITERDAKGPDYIYDMGVDTRKMHHSSNGYGEDSGQLVHLLALYLWFSETETDSCGQIEPIQRLVRACDL